jgi:GT2 family glycosyltransferase
MEAPRVAVVSSATGAEYAQWTREWLGSVLKTDYPNGRWSIDLLDDGGELVDPLGGSSLIHPVPKQPSISSAFNRALEFGLSHDPDYVCLLTTSTRPVAKDWITRLVQCHESHPTAGIVGTRNVNADGSLNHAGMAILRLGDQLVGLHVGRDIERGVNLELIEREVEATTGACMMFKRAVLDRGVRFDPRIRQNSNDVDVCLQARSLGFSIVYTPNVVLWRDEGHTRNDPKYRVDLAADSRVFSTKWYRRAPAW